MIIKNKVSFVAAVSLLVDVDMGVQAAEFPSARPQKGNIVEYDAATVYGVAPEYNSFANTAKVVSKDGKDTVRLAPVNYNNSISKDEIDANVVRFGQNEYGDGKVDMVMESALNGVGKLHLNRLVGMKSVMYEVLTTHRIANGFVGKDGVEDIVFNVPAANKEVFDGTTLKYWSDTANATPLVDIKRAWTAMKIKPRKITMNDNTYSNFRANPTITTADNNNTGTAYNFEVNKNVNTDADYFKAGRITHEGMMLDVYVERGRQETATGPVPSMPDGYVVYTGGAKGTTEYGGIPVAVKGSGVRNIAAEYDVQEVITQNPPQHLLVYRSAPLPAIKQGEAYFSQKVEA